MAICTSFLLLFDCYLYSGQAFSFRFKLSYQNLCWLPLLHQYQLPDLFNKQLLRWSTAKQTSWFVRPAKTQISLDVRTVWSESSLGNLWVAKTPMLLHADSEDSDQTGRMPRLIWVFAGRTGHVIGFIMLWLNYYRCLMVLQVLMLVFDTETRLP